MLILIQDSFFFGRMFKLIVALNILAIAAGYLAGKNFSMVLVGGGLKDFNEEIWGRVVDLAGGKGKARIGVVAAAGEDPCCDVESSFFYYEKELLHFGAAEVYYINVTVDTKFENANPDILANIRRMTGFFFSGGDQQRVIYSFYNEDEKVPSPALLAIKDTLLRNGGVVAGTSAGTDCQTINTMISGGESYAALRDGAKVFWRSLEYIDQDTLTAYGPGGIGLFTHGLLDTHFANRGRQGRMIKLMADTHSHPVGSTRAFGIDENTALVVTGPWSQRVGEVIGERGVYIFNTAETVLPVTLPDGASSTETLIGVRTHRLSVGDRIDLTTLAVVPASYKTPLSGRETSETAKASADIFGAGSFEFDAIATSLFTSTARFTSGVTAETGPQFEVHLDKSWSACMGVDAAMPVSAVQDARGFDGINPATGLYAYSYADLCINIAPVSTTA